MIAVDLPLPLRQNTPFRIGWEREIGKRFETFFPQIFFLCIFLTILWTKRFIIDTDKVWVFNGEKKIANEVVIMFGLRKLLRFEFFSFVLSHPPKGEKERRKLFAVEIFYVFVHKTTFIQFSSSLNEITYMKWRKKKKEVFVTRNSFGIIRCFVSSANVHLTFFFLFLLVHWNISLDFWHYIYCFYCSLHFFASCRSLVFLINWKMNDKM